MVRCTYCSQTYTLTNKTQEEFIRAVNKHVQATHPDKWNKPSPGDVWAIAIPDKV